MDTLEAKEKFSFNLLHPEDRAFDITVLYMVYRTIEQNQSITLNQLRWMLYHEYMLQNTVVDGAVASLTSKSLFDCVSRWTPPRKNDTIHLRTRKGSAAFDEWLSRNTAERPELLIFTPPIFSAKGNQPAPAGTSQQKST